MFDRIQNAMKKEYLPYIIYTVVFIVCLFNPLILLFPNDEGGLGQVAVLLLATWGLSFILSLFTGIIQSSRKKWLFVPYVWLVGFIFDLFYWGVHRILHGEADFTVLAETVVVSAFVGMLIGSLIHGVFLKD